MIDWDRLVLEPLEAVFGEGEQGGEQIMYHPLYGDPYAIDGVFDEAYRDADLIDGLVGANTTMPVLGVRLARFQCPPKQNDQVVIPRTGKTYIIKDVQPDSHGSLKLMLGEMDDYYS